ncbi:MAG: RNA-protein complex protein Nop10 [Nitrososphaeria archaeon]
MRQLLKKCPKCLLYTLREACPNCGSPTISPHPPKFSPDDKYAYLKSNII